MDFIILLVNLFLGLGCGIGVFFIFARIIVAISSAPDYWADLEADLSAERMALNGQMVNLLYKIGKPMDNGRFSSEQHGMWEDYKAMNKKYDEMFVRHTNIIINRKR